MHVLVLLGDLLRRVLTHARIVVSLAHERRHRKPLAEVLHVVESKIIAHLLLRVHVRVVRLAIRHIVHAVWELLLRLLWCELQVLLDLIEDLPVAWLLAWEVVELVRLGLRLLHLERL